MFQNFADWITGLFFGPDCVCAPGAALNFFVYNAVWMTVILFCVSFAMGLLNAAFPPGRLGGMLSRGGPFGFGYFAAAVFGALTPFCACSSIPIFIGLVSGGIPLGVAFAFLITSPLINEVAVAMFMGAFGYRAAFAYVAGGLMLGVCGGFLLGRMGLEGWLTPWARSARTAPHPIRRAGAAEAVLGALRGSVGIVRGVLPYVLGGLAVGAVIHGYLPENFFGGILKGAGVFSVPAAVAAGVPFYANSAGAVPIVQALVSKGVPLGTATAFMMSVVGLSIPEAAMLKKVMSLKMLAVFFATEAALIAVFGCALNAVL